MSTRLITLTTDFGEGSFYVAAMKGVILGINPNARLVDLSHSIPPQDIRQAAWFLARSLPWFPPKTIHVVVVDPGVGTDRKLLLVHAGPQWLLAPDNGCWTLAADKLSDQPHVWALRSSIYWRLEVSQTFHGRDILAPVAGHLSGGVPPQRFGPLAQGWMRLSLPDVRIEARRLRGEVILADGFGNLITNISSSLLKEKGHATPVVRLGRKRVHRFVRTYGEAKEGETVALIGSDGFLEVAVVNGNAAEALDAGVGTAVEVASGVQATR